MNQQPKRLTRILRRAMGLTMDLNTVFKYKNPPFQVSAARSGRSPLDETVEAGEIYE